MTAPNPLVAATDFSDCAGHAAHRAAMLAAQWRAPLTLLHVVNRSLPAQWKDLFGSDAKAQSALHDEAVRRLGMQAARLGDLGIDDMPAPSLQVAVGSVHDELVDAGAAAGMLVLGAQGATPLRDLLIGSTAERLLRHARCPVLVVRRAPQGPYRRVLVPTDFSPASTAAIHLVERLAPDAVMTLVHAFDVPYEGMLRFAGVSEAAIQAHDLRVHREMHAKLADLERAHGNARLPAIIERKHPVQLILEAEQSRAADLIVIGRQGASRVEEFLLGSVARRVLADAKCDVLVATGEPALA